MNTLADINRFAQTLVVTSIDADTPAGHFTALTRIMGVPTLYLLKGTQDAENARIVGRVEVNEFHSRSFAYRGERLRGGRFMGENTNTRDTFYKMTTAA